MKKNIRITTNLEKGKAIQNLGNTYPAGNYLFKINNGNTITMCEIYSKLNNSDTRTKSVTSFWRFHWLRADLAHCSGVSIVDLEQVYTGWVVIITSYYNRTYDNSEVAGDQTTIHNCKHCIIL